MGVVAVAAVLASACGNPAPRRAEDMAMRVVSRGSLAYAVAFTDERMLTIELVERFELVVRTLAGQELGRVDLGAPERDWVALAAVGDRAWAGGVGGTVAAIDLAAVQITERWPIGAPVTALAVAGDAIAIGDREGVLCVRSLDDGALRQCVVAHDQPIEGLAVVGDELRSRGGDGERAWTLPALGGGTAPEPELDGGLGWGDAVVHARGRRVEAGREGRLVVEMAGAVRALAISPSGELAVAAWISALDQASVVLVSPRHVAGRMGP